MTKCALSALEIGVKLWYTHADGRVMDVTPELENIHYEHMLHLNVMLVGIEQREYHEHKELELFAVLDGEAEITTGKEKFTVSRGSVTAFNYRAAHGIRALDGAVKAIVVQISPYFCREYTSHCRRMMVCDARVTQSSPQAGAEIFRLMCMMVIHYYGYYEGDRLFELRCVDDVMKIYLTLAENVECEYIGANRHHARIAAEHRLDEVRSYIDTNYQTPIRLEDAAQIAGMSPSHLSHFFSKNMGVSFRDYLNGLRFQHALRQIDRTNMALADVAMGSGFSDPKYMTKMFVKNLGCTPREYRERIRNAGRKLPEPERREEYQTIFAPEESVETVSRYLEEM